MKKEGCGTFFLLWSIGILLISFTRADTPVSLEINNASLGPQLIRNIPDQSWPMDTNNINAFDLDDYFNDPLGYGLNYSVTPAANILIIINETTNLVSFYPTPSFMGTRTITFDAKNNWGGSASSNLVRLTIMNDSEPPKWFNPQKNKVKIYQNDYVNFSTVWTDNFALQNYTFFINQAGTWSSSLSVFTGTQNTSRGRVQISAPGGSVVYWRFQAQDSYGNLNMTPLMNFTIETPPQPPIPEERGGASSGKGASGMGTSIEEKVKRTVAFTVDPAIIKVSLRQGESSTKFIKINNIGINALFSITVENGNEFIRLLSKSQINLSEGKSDAVALEITAGRLTPPDLYMGLISITAGGVVKKVPIALVVRSKEEGIEIYVIIPPEESSLQAGDDITANITFLTMEQNQTDIIRVTYAIKDWEGNNINADEEQRPLLNDNWEKTLNIPQSTAPGSYIFYARATHQMKTAADVEVFTVEDMLFSPAFVKKNLRWLLFLLLFLIILLLAWSYGRNRKKNRLLTLYLLTNELKETLRANKSEESVNLFIKLKEMYGEPVSDTLTTNKEQLKNEVETWLKTRGKDISTPQEIKSLPKDSAKDESQKEEKKEESSKVEKKIESQKEEKKEEIQKIEVSAKPNITPKNANLEKQAVHAHVGKRKTKKGGESPKNK